MEWLGLSAHDLHVDLTLRPYEEAILRYTENHGGWGGEDGGLQQKGGRK